MAPTVHSSAGTRGSAPLLQRVGAVHRRSPALRRAREDLEGRLSETRERDRGLAFESELERMSLPLLAEWVALERRCCPFFEFTIEVGPERNSTWLSLAGEEGVKDSYRHELALATGHG